MIKIERAKIIFEKPSGAYGCPQFISPAVAQTIAESVGIGLDNEAAKALAEVAENFAMELLSGHGGKSLAAADIRKLVTTAVLV
jgi:hypothetical protein